MLKLFKHQEEILKKDPKKTGIFLGTGAGKSLLTLLLARGNTLVICPKTQKLDQNWEREFKNNFSDMQITNLTVMSKEEFRRDYESIKYFDTVIIDEAHTCLGVTANTRQRNKMIIPKASQIFDALQEYLSKRQPDRLYLVTATIIRSPMTVWAAGTLLGKKWDFYKFRSTFYVRLPIPGREAWQAKSDNTTKERLAKAVKGIGYVGRLEDFFDVPEQTFKTDYIELTEEQKKRIKEIPLEYPDPIVQIGKQHQIENGILAETEFGEREMFHSLKNDRILDYAIEFPRMVIFVKYTAQIDHIARMLFEAGKIVFILDGRTKDRKEVILNANESKECILVAQAQISSGWQLGKTKDHPEYYDYNVMLFASMDYSVINRIQGEGRILRSDNLKKNLFITLVSKGGGIDEAVFKCINEKKDFNEKLYELRTS